MNRLTQHAAKRVRGCDARNRFRRIGPVACAASTSVPRVSLTAEQNRTVSSSAHLLRRSDTTGTKRTLHGRLRPWNAAFRNHSVVVTQHSKSYTPTPVDPTQLVDRLLGRTRTLMDGSKHHIIAYSGGVDSSLVAALVHKAATPDETVTAVLGLSPAVPAEQVRLAEQVAGVAGFALEKTRTTEGTDDVYIENNGQACLACKTHLYTCLDAIVAKHGTSDRQLYNGTNADDVKDPTRLGLIAAQNFRVKSPLIHTTKEHVRIAARHLGLPNWNHAASPCLRSRLALGVEALPQHLYRIESAERFVRNALGLDATQNMRVRLLANNRAMVEVEHDVLPRADTMLSDAWTDYFQKDLKFDSVGIRAFKSGSVANKESSGADNGAGVGTVKAIELEEDDNHNSDSQSATLKEAY